MGACCKLQPRGFLLHVCFPLQCALNCRGYLPLTICHRERVEQAVALVTIVCVGEDNLYERAEKGIQYFRVFCIKQAKVPETSLVSRSEIIQDISFTQILFQAFYASSSSPPLAGKEPDGGRMGRSQDSWTR